MKTLTLPDAICQQIDAWVSKYPAGQQQSAVLSALLIVQDASPDHCLTPELVEAVAAYLKIPAISAWEAATFYSMYDHTPTGKYKIGVCNNLPCKLRGADELVAHLEKKLQVQVSETTPDRRFTLKTEECLGACIGAPMCRINKTYHENLSPEKIDQILNELE